MANLIEDNHWNSNPLDLDILDDAFEDANYLNNYNESDFQSLNDLDLSLLLPETPPDTPDNDSQASNQSSDSMSDISPSSPSSNASSNDYLYSPVSNVPLSITTSSPLHPHQQPISSLQQNPYQASHLESSLIPNQSFITNSPQNILPNSDCFIVQPNPASCLPGELVLTTNGFTNYSNYQPFIQALPIIQGPGSVKATPTNVVKQSNFKPIACKPIVSSQPQVQILSKSTSSSSSSLSRSSSSSQDNDEISKKNKLEERKKKNRIASTNSRLKQKDYIAKMEKNVRELSQENDSLRNENRSLKARVRELENILQLRSNDNVEAKDINGNYHTFSKDKLSPSKTKLSMFAVLCFVCFQVSPYFTSTLIKNDIIPVNSTEIQLLNSKTNPNYPIHYGRHLLWADDKNNNLEDDSFTKNRPNLNGTIAPAAKRNVYRNQTLEVKCADYFNQTESIRLENELRDILNRLKFEDYEIDHRQRRIRIGAGSTTSDKRIVNKNRRNHKKYLLFDSKNVPIQKLKMWMNKQNNFYQPSHNQDDGSNSDQSQSHNQKDEKAYPRKLAQDSSLFDYDSLLGNIHRRDDTFYYLSYPSNGHLFLPPISNRTDVRPRFSFLIPSFNNLTLDESLNERNRSAGRRPHNLHGNSTRTHQMVLLQIDCQVINTKVTLIDSDLSMKNNFKN